MAETVPVKKVDLEVGGDEVEAPARIEGLKRVMAPRHTQMIAIGGILGSGVYAADLAMLSRASSCGGKWRRELDTES